MRFPHISCLQVQPPTINLFLTLMKIVLDRDKSIRSVELSSEVRSGFLRRDFSSSLRFLDFSTQVSRNTRPENGAADLGFFSLSNKPNKQIKYKSHKKILASKLTQTKSRNNWLCIFQKLITNICYIKLCVIQREWNTSATQQLSDIIDLSTMIMLHSQSFLSCFP